MLFGTGSVWTLGLSAGLATHRAHSDDTDLQVSSGLALARSLYRIRMTEYPKDGVWECHALTDDGWGPVIMLELGPQFVHREQWRAGAYTSLFFGLHTVQDDMPWGASIGVFLRSEILLEAGTDWALVLGLRIDGLMVLLSPLAPLFL